VNSTSAPSASLNVAVLIPCYNEEATICQVVGDFKRVLPDADVYVFDNNSVDATAEVAKQAGAIVVFEPRQGKGFVINRMFRSIEADVYLLVDGDDTYDPASGPELVRLVSEAGYDMAIVARLIEYKSMAFRRFHL
jgi:glycosyltransferase involved in cell wall biosynthesis